MAALDAGDLESAIEHTGQGTSSHTTRDSTRRRTTATKRWRHSKLGTPTRREYIEAALEATQS